MRKTDIEPGCLAMIINSRAGHNGKIVTVLTYVGDVPHMYGKHYWRIDTELKTVLGNPEPYARSDQLMRIDGYEEQSQEITKEKELSYE